MSPKLRKDAIDGGEITAAEAARRLGMTSQALGVWCTRPSAPVRKEGRNVLVQWPAFARWRERELIDEAMPGDLETARTRKANAEAELAEIEVAKARGEVVLVADYEQALGTILDRLTARLRGLPVQLASAGPDAEALAETEVERIIVELSQFDEDVIDEGLAASDGRAA
jgi:phage terminase Nu1 subunit (DNA packaging protein)